MVRTLSTWTSDVSASRTLSLLITCLIGVELEIGVREWGGLGGGNGWSSGVPYWRGKFWGWWAAALGGTDEEIGGINGNKELDARKLEGLTRWVIGLPLLIVSWEADGIWIEGTGDNKPPGTVEVTLAEW